MKFKIVSSTSEKKSEPEITAELYVNQNGALALRLNGEHVANLIDGDGDVLPAIESLLRRALKDPL